MGAERPIARGHKPRRGTEEEEAGGPHDLLARPPAEPGLGTPAAPGSANTEIFSVEGKRLGEI